MGYLAVEGDRSIYFEHHTGNKRPTVVLSHGWGMGSKAWANTLARLQDEGYPVVVYDHRGCGNSDKDFADVSIEALGDDVVKLCKHLGLDQVVVNGWSLGGAVVVDAASKLGGNLAGLVLTAGASPRYTQAEGFPYGGQPEDVAATVTALRADRVNFLKGLYFEGVFAKEVGDDVKQWAWHIALEAGPAADASLGALANLDQRDAMAQLQVPALVVVGGQDGVAPPEIGRFAADCLPNARLLEMSDCGHGPFLEDADTYHAELLAYLGSL